MELELGMENTTGNPTLPGLRWQPITVADLDAVTGLAAASYRTDGGIAFLNEPENLKWRYFRDAPGEGIGAFNPDGHLVACTTVRVEREAETARARIAGQVHPEWRRRGIGTYLLRWSVERAQTLLAADPAGSQVLEIATETLTAAADRLYRAHGFAPVTESLVMRRDLRRPLPECPLLEGITLAGWQPDLAGQFYEAYHASFRDRPGFPGWSAEEWIAWTADDNLRPEWSLLAHAAGVPLGFVTAGVEHVDSFILQIGVIPEQRRRGLASALMAEAMRRMRVDGETATELNVNRNNPGAVQAYLKLGFVENGRRARYTRIGGLPHEASTA